ncbi:MAG: HAD-IIB family hydrolase [Firmicutes bacterium]|nr:HAD-IIB family hydrolase [Bacillota bacterium]
MKKDVKLIICDIDNTLRSYPDPMSQFMINTMNEIHERGILFGLASGRPVDDIIGSIQPWNLTFKPDVVIGMNGCEIWDEKDQTLTTTDLLDQQTLQEIMELMKGIPTYPRIYQDGAIKGIPGDPMIDMSAKKVGRRVDTCDTIDEFWKEENAKIMFFCEPEHFEEVKEYCLAHQSEKYIAFQTGPILMEMCSPNATKGNGLKKYVEKYNIPLDLVMSFGDTSNDNSMLEITYGVCLLNGSEDTKAVAKEITEFTCKESGFAHYIHDHLFD